MLQLKEKCSYPHNYFSGSGRGIDNVDSFSSAVFRSKSILSKIHHTHSISKKRDTGSRGINHSSRESRKQIYHEEACITQWTTSWICPGTLPKVMVFSPMKHSELQATFRTKMIQEQVAELLLIPLQPKLHQGLEQIYTSALSTGSAFSWLMQPYEDLQDSPALNSCCPQSSEQPHICGKGRWWPFSSFFPVPLSTVGQAEWPPQSLLALEKKSQNKEARVHLSFLYLYEKLEFPKANVRSWKLPKLTQSKPDTL